MTPTELQTVLDKHRAWLRGEADGSRANLRMAYLSGAYLSGANLSGADLRGALVGAGRKLAAGRPLVLSFDHDWALALLRCEDGGIAVTCGCRWFDSPHEARKHWQEHRNEQHRDIVIPALDQLLCMAKLQGWPIPSEVTE